MKTLSNIGDFLRNLLGSETITFAANNPSPQPTIQVTPQPQPTARPAAPQNNLLASEYYGNTEPPPGQGYDLSPSPSLFSNFTRGTLPSDLRNAIYVAAKQNNIDPELLAALLFQESGFKPTANATNTGGSAPGSIDRGVAAINNLYHPDVTDQQAYDPNFAIPYAAKLLASNISQFGGDIPQGVAAYNGGVGGVRSNGLAPYARYLQGIAANLNPDYARKIGLIQ